MHLNFREMVLVQFIEVVKCPHWDAIQCVPGAGVTEGIMQWIPFLNHVQSKGKRTCIRMTWEIEALL